MSMTRASSRWVFVLGLLGCASSPPSSAPTTVHSPSGAAPARSPAPPSAPADPDLAYYRQHAATLSDCKGPAIAQLDWKRLRRGSMLHVGGTLADHALETALNEALQRPDEDAVLTAAQEVLRRDGAHIKAHVVTANLLDKRGRTEDATSHGACVKALLGSVAASGDGKAPETAFVVFHLREEYDVLKAINLELVSQSLVTKGERTFDVLSVKRKDGTTRDIYFDVTAFYALGTE